MFVVVLMWTLLQLQHSTLSVLDRNYLIFLQWCLEKWVLDDLSLLTNSLAISSSEASSSGATRML